MHLSWHKKGLGHITDIGFESPFEVFVLKATNIPRIWEIIMSYISGTDVANCLKVCKGLRFVIGQCLYFSSRFRQEMDIAATASAISKGWIKSKYKLELSSKLGKNVSKTMTYSIDRRWYYNGRRKICFKPQLRKVSKPIQLPKVIGPIYNVFPTMDPKYVYVQCSRRLALLELKKSIVKAIFDPEDDIGLEKIPQEPFCIQYRLFAKSEHDGNRVIVIMRLVNSSRYAVKNVTLYHLEGNSNIDLPHVSSNEEVN